MRGHVTMVNTACRYPSKYYAFKQARPDDVPYDLVSSLLCPNRESRHFTTFDRVTLAILNEIRRARALSPPRWTSDDDVDQLLTMIVSAASGVCLVSSLWTCYALRMCMVDSTFYREMNTALCTCDGEALLGYREYVRAVYDLCESKVCVHGGGDDGGDVLDRCLCICWNCISWYFVG